MQPLSSHFRTPLNVVYPRPSRLSNPDHEYPDDFKNAMLAKHDFELERKEFRHLLGPYHFAGTYEQSVYFLPLSLEYLVTHDENALDLITSIVWFISEYAGPLAADGLLVGARGRISECFEIWTSRFNVTHFDQAECKAKGWRGRAYFDCVKNTEVICQGTEDLVRFDRHADLAAAFFRSLADYGTDPIKAAWFLEMSRSQTDVYHPPEYQAIRELLGDRNLIRSAASVVQMSLVADEPSPTYWRDTLAAVRAAE